MNNPTEYLLEKYGKWMTVQQVATELQMSVITARKMLKDGDIRGFRARTSIRIETQSVVDHVDRGVYPDSDNVPAVAAE